MVANLPLSQHQLWLPNIDLIESSEQAFGNAFLKAAQILCQHLEQIKLSIGFTEDFTKEPFNLALLDLFSKMCRNYYSYVLLEIHHDRIGSQFLIEHLCEAAITLTYLVEKVDESLFFEYISASVHQADRLLIDVEEQLRKFPNHSDLLSLRDKLETFITQQQEHGIERPLTACSEAYLWGPEEANTTAKRGGALGLNFLTNPARQIALKVIPASWLELQLNYSNSFAESSRAKAKAGINFTDLRDAAHLCLHATQTFLEEVVNHQNVNFAGIELQQLLNVLYEWFHNAHHVYQLRCCATTQEKDDCESSYLLTLGTLEAPSRLGNIFS
jgi:hypothetical protein